MPSPTQLPPLHLAVRDSAELSWEPLEELLGTALFEAFTDSLLDAVVVIGPDGRVRLCNQAAERALTLSRQQALARSIEEVSRASGLGLHELFAAPPRAPDTALLSGGAGAKSYTATRRVIRCRQSAGCGAMLVLRECQPIEGFDQPSRNGPGESEDGEELTLPAEVRTLLEQAVRAMKRRARLLLAGESGVGKTAIARRLHLAAIGAGRPFVHVNCGSIPESLFESEMFGYERGAFTGALHSGKRGYIESAAGGTLFLDEVGEIPLASQAKLLKFLEDGTIQPIGVAISRLVQCQIIAATNRDLAGMVEQASFRPDLYYRLKNFTVRLPALRERGDVNELIDALLARINATRGASLVLSEECRLDLLRYRYPGNIRELSNILEHLSIVAGRKATPEDLPEDIRRGTGGEQLAAGSSLNGARELATLKEHVRMFEDEIIRMALDRYGSKREAARLLGVDIATVVRKTRRRGATDGGGKGRT